MKRYVLGLFLMVLMVTGGLSASGSGQAKEKASAAQDTRVEIPQLVVNAIYGEQPEPIIDWLNENPAKNKNAITKAYTKYNYGQYSTAWFEKMGNGRTLLWMTVAKTYSIYDMKVFRYLVALKPDALAKDHEGRDAFDAIFLIFEEPSEIFQRAAYYHIPGRIQREVALSIIKLMVEQGVDIEQLIQRAKKYESDPDALRPRIQSISFDMLREVQRAFASKVIDLLRNEKEKVGLRKAGEELAEREGCVLPKVLGTLLAASNPHLLAIKHAIEDNDEKKLKEALEDNKWIELKDGTGYTPFLYAAYINKPDMMRYLISWGADEKAKTNNNVGATYFDDGTRGYQKLIDEERNEYVQNLEYERKDEAELIKKAAEEILLTIETNNYDELKNINVYDAYHDSEVVNYRYHDKRTALMIAALGGKTRFVELFLDNGADTSLQDDKGNTALHLAILEGHWAIASLLVSRMSSEAIREKNKNRITAYDLVMKYKERNKDNPEFQKLMKELTDSMASMSATAGAVKKD